MYYRRKKSQGIKIGSRYMWDTTCDSAVSTSWENEYTYAFCVTYGVYYYFIIIYFSKKNCKIKKKNFFFYLI